MAWYEWLDASQAVDGRRSGTRMDGDQDGSVRMDGTER